MIRQLAYVSKNAELQVMTCVSKLKKNEKPVLDLIPGVREKTCQDHKSILGFKSHKYMLFSS